MASLWWTSKHRIKSPRSDPTQTQLVCLRWQIQRLGHWWEAIRRSRSSLVKRFFLFLSFSWEKKKLTKILMKNLTFIFFNTQPCRISSLETSPLPPPLPRLPQGLPRRKEQIQKLHQRYFFFSFKSRFSFLNYSLDLMQNVAPSQSPRPSRPSRPPRT